MLAREQQSSLNYRQCTKPHSCAQLFGQRPSAHADWPVGVGINPAADVPAISWAPSPLLAETASSSTTGSSSSIIDTSNAISSTGVNSAPPSSAASALRIARSLDCPPTYVSTPAPSAVAPPASSTASFTTPSSFPEHPRSREREVLAVAISYLPKHGRPGDRAYREIPTDPLPSRVHPPVPASLNAPAGSRRAPVSASKSLHPSSANVAAQGSSPFSGLSFRPRGSSSARRHVRRLSAARLWNPTNSTPRPHTARKRRPSTPPSPPVPLEHPTLDDSQVPDHLGITAPGNYPLLTLPEQRQSRHSGSTRASLQVDRRASSDTRVGLPTSVRASFDGKSHQSSLRPATGIDVGESSANPESNKPPVKLDKGKGIANMASQTDNARSSFHADLERGPDTMEPRLSNVSLGDGIGSALSTTNSSIMGEEVEPDAAGEWGPQHPCYPHLNPHVPLDSHEYATTRIIRIRRDWLMEGDLAPTFSNLYPEILDPAGLSEQEFRRIIEKLNGEITPTFNPYSTRNIMDGVLGLVTGWLWDDFGMTGIKTRLNNLEKWIEKWNLNMEKTMGVEDGVTAPRIISLRQTGYMTLDIQIPDPEIAPAPRTSIGGSRTALPLEPAHAVMA